MRRFFTSIYILIVLIIKNSAELAFLLKAFSLARKYKLDYLLVFLLTSIISMYFVQLYNYTIEYNNYINDIIDYKDSNYIIMPEKNKVGFHFTDLLLNKSCIYVPSFFVKSNFSNLDTILNNVDTNLELKFNTYDIMLKYRYKLTWYYDMKCVNILQDILNVLNKDNFTL